jgi:hypothetical protein
MPITFLNQDGEYPTSARNDGNGNPITDVSIAQSGVGFDSNSDSFKTRVVNSVEIADSDAFQSSMLLYPISGRSATPTEVKLTPPSGAKGFIVELFIQSANAEMVAGQGARIKVTGSGHDGQPLGGLQVLGDYEYRANRRQTLIWYPGVNIGNIRNDDSYKTYVAPIPVPKEIKVVMDIIPSANAGGVVAGMTLGWLT